MKSTYEVSPVIANPLAIHTSHSVVGFLFDKAPARDRAEMDRLLEAIGETGTVCPLEWARPIDEVKTSQCYGIDNDVRKAANAGRMDRIASQKRYISENFGLSEAQTRMLWAVLSSWRGHFEIILNEPVREKLFAKLASEKSFPKKAALTTFMSWWNAKSDGSKQLFEELWPSLGVNAPKIMRQLVPKLNTLGITPKLGVTSGDVSQTSRLEKLELIAYSQLVPEEVEFFDEDYHTAEQKGYVSSPEDDHNAELIRSAEKQIRLYSEWADQGSVSRAEAIEAIDYLQSEIQSLKSRDFGLDEFDYRSAMVSPICSLDAPVGTMPMRWSSDFLSAQADKILNQIDDAINSFMETIRGGMANTILCQMARG